jgi:uncharacterized protein (DUF58 family)
MNRPTLLPTPRLLFLLLTAVLLWAISGLVGFLTILALLLLVVLVLMVRLDWQRTPEPEVLQWQREHHTKMGLGAENVITIVVHNESERTLDVMVRDETPADFRLVRGSNRMGVRVPGRGQMRLNYEVKPTRRGDHSLAI